MNKETFIHRVAIGALGMVLPVACLLFGYFGRNNYHLWYETMSATYYTPAITMFVGVLFCAGLFLSTYVGYDWRDKLINILSGIFAIGIAVFPCGATNDEIVGMFSLPVKVSQVIHIICAGLFFALLAVNILWLFRQTSGELTDRKKLRNKIYLICGIGILSAILVMGLNSIFGWFGFLGWICEFFMLEFFGIAWIIKSNAILKDK